MTIRLRGVNTNAKRTRNITDGEGPEKAKVASRPRLTRAQQDRREHQQERKLCALHGWLASVQASLMRELHQLAPGIERDWAASTAALSRPESNGMTEGFVNTLKYIKHSMYGRGSFELLRQQVLKAP